jgi:RimJ/RimL family protein N-acetyltransferase
MRAQDVSAEYISWWNDPQIQDGLNMPVRNWTRPQAVKHVSRFNNIDRFHLGIYRKGSGELVGFVAVFHNSQLATATINIVIGNKKFWGSRVPKELREIVFPFIFKRLKVAKLKLEVVGHNRSSLSMCKSLGLVEEGVLRQEKPHYQGGRVDVYVFRMLAEEWQAIACK